MGMIREAHTGEELVLEPNHLVGRSEHCSLRLREAHISAEHASIRWDGERWLLRDLGSRNSTYHNGEPLPPSGTTTLALDSRIAFGNLLAQFVLIDASAPATLAQPIAGGHPIVAEAGLLALPSKERPVLTVYRNTNGEWVVDTGRSIEYAVHRGVVDVEGQEYRLFLAHATAETAPLAALYVRTVASISLDFLVSRDEEHIELRARLGHELHDCGTRTHNYLLLFLARRRQQDAAASEPPAACGWVFQEELCDALRVDPERLNVDVYRVRRQFAALKLADPAEIIQRRPRTKQLRIGVTSCTIEFI